MNRAVNRAVNRVIVVGEAMVELTETSDGSVQRGFGGDTFNTAVHLARRRRDSIRYVSTLGGDSLSESLLAFASAEGIDTSGVVVRPTSQVGLYLAHVDASGERTFTYWRSQSAARATLGDTWPSDHEPDPGAIDVLVFSGISLAVFDQGGRQRLLALADEVAAGGGRVVYDPNHRPSLWSTDEAVACLRRIAATGALVSIGSSDGEALVDETNTVALARMLRELGSDETVVRDGPRPCRCSWGDHDESVVAIEVDDVVDTTGAGDAFNAGYLDARLRGEPPPLAARAGHELAAGVVRHVGAIARKGTRKEPV